MKFPGMMMTATPFCCETVFNPVLRSEAEVELYTDLAWVCRRVDAYAPRVLLSSVMTPIVGGAVDCSWIPWILFPIVAKIKATRIIGINVAGVSNSRISFLVMFPSPLIDAPSV